MVKVSVIVPVYNSEQYLRQCLNSLLAQTMSDIEIICVNDASTDQSFQILKEYRRKEPRIKLLSNPENMGVSYSRNLALDIAGGEYIQFVDADDYIEKETIEELFKQARQTNADMTYMGMHFDIDNNEEGSVVQQGILGEYQEVYEGCELLCRLAENKEFFLYGWSVFYHKRFLDEYQIRFENLRIGEGGDFILRSLCRAKRVIVCNNKYYHYRIHKASAMHSNKAKKELLLGQTVQYMNLFEFMANNKKDWSPDVFLSDLWRKIAGGLQNLTQGEIEEISKKFDSSFRKNLFQLLSRDAHTYEININRDRLEQIHNKKYVIIYGAGFASKDVIQFLQRHEIEILGFAITKRNDGKTALYGHHIYEISELESYASDSIVLVAANKKYNREIEDILDKYGFRSRIFLDIEI